ncbi:LuxR family transcriptional regulator [Fluoribacter dumoffii]|uniref:Transcriptional activator protein luxR n=1 Tax=Fluoribacter dumoffii TaxID=463 RepID=A0A377GC41_9GAMM|nr:LuxR family transcriptional regulator [Fluoribacter dumoffii]KTC90539.1 LuxR family transcriptional regulator [Fluoribacter dumoffii NY 23]MCW8386219.1 LuxR family transcriptional regulator [Fluoribacter dumoffii]MCW8419270.1 LuxR family transcriptional regulator [Fluoribacter dumoffii]MCW8452855.1 LuxR family transcriptional regulator [Fluoribacter dumoffii]MCW8459895.1 LuxR family transcriptional regulator [Fluoribacter dumoffii]
MTDLLVILEERLVQAESLAECDHALSFYLGKKGITTFSFTYYAYHPNTANHLKYDMCSANFKSWHQHYLAEQYHSIDSTLSFVYSNHLPIYWNLKQQLAQAASESERQMREDSIAFGAESGLSIPIHGPHNNFAILLLVQMQNQQCNLQDNGAQHEFFVAAHLYYHYIQSHLLDQVSEKDAFHLTRREIQCLLLIAQQHSVKEISQRLEISERTVNFHIQKINKKLGTKNKYQSLAKALEYQLLIL